jgi:hypothetical protein
MLFTLNIIRPKHCVDHDAFMFFVFLVLLILNSHEISSILSTIKYDEL